MNIRGDYIINYYFQNMFNNTHINIEYSNLITNKGVNYFINRLINNKEGIINGLALGDGTKAPTNKDTDLTSLKCLKKPSVEIERNTLVFTSLFNYNEANNCTEIGLYYNEVLITHDIFPRIPVPTTGFINIRYRIKIQNSVHELYWQRYDEDLFYTGITEKVISVYDNEQNYVRTESIEELKRINVKKAYHQNKNKIFIKTNTNPLENGVYILR